MDLSSADYTAAVQTALAAATVEAAMMHAANLEPEHLLLSLLTPASGAAWSVLLGVIRDPAALRQPILAALSEAATTTENISPPYSYRAQRVLSEASDEAQRSGSPQIDTPHLLLGILDEGGAAAQVLRQRGLDARNLRYWLRQPHAPSPAAPATAVPTQPAPPPPPHPLRDVPLRQALPRLISWPAVIILIIALVVGGWMTTWKDLSDIGIVLVIIGGWVVSLSAHEFAHALVADLGGDHTVRDKGYLSFNPLKYTHIMLSVVLPIIFLLIGGIALPGGAVYIDHSRLRGPKWESAVSAAGPAASLLVTIIVALPFMLDLVRGSIAFAVAPLWAALAALILFNIAGVILNLLPIPPLDGFGIIAPWLTPGLRARLYMFSSFGFLILIAALWSPPINDAFWNTIFDLLQRLGVNPALAAIGIQRLMFWR
jgi:Zn-dependent protease